VFTGVALYNIILIYYNIICFVCSGCSSGGFFTLLLVFLCACSGGLILCLWWCSLVICSAGAGGLCFCCWWALFLVVLVAFIGAYKHKKKL